MISGCKGTKFFLNLQIIPSLFAYLLMKKASLIMNVPYFIFHCAIDSIDTGMVNGIKAKV